MLKYEILNLIGKHDKNVEERLDHFLECISFSNDIEDCYKEQNKIIKEISMNWKHWGILPFNEENNSTYKPITYEDRNGDAISVSCYHFPENTSNNNLKISLDSREFKNYLKGLRQ